MNTDFFAHKLISWYNRHKRDLPWRNTRNPYFIWLSEIILQQTRVVQGLPYYQKFIENFPTVQDLAAADEKEVLRLWQGLGYYSRARNLHTTAKMVVSEFGGVFPDTYNELLKLKGIGSYTAAAIASFSHDEKVAVLDGNVYRVLSRVFGVETDIAGKDAKKVFGKLATELLPDQQVSTYNQAIMEFGAIQCTPGLPQCMFCTFSPECSANELGKQCMLPVKSKKVKVKERFFHYFILEKEGRFAMKERNGKDVWSGMYDFYLTEQESMQDLSVLAGNDTFIDALLRESTISQESEKYLHILTHQRITAQFWHIQINPDSKIELPENLKYYSLNEIDDLPKSTLVNNYLKQYFFEK